jgi:hypothetical protein
MPNDTAFRVPNAMEDRSQHVTRPLCVSVSFIQGPNGATACTHSRALFARESDMAAYAAKATIDSSVASTGPEWHRQMFVLLRKRLPLMVLGRKGAGRTFVPDKSRADRYGIRIPVKMELYRLDTSRTVFGKRKRRIRELSSEAQEMARNAEVFVIRMPYEQHRKMNSVDRMREILIYSTLRSISKTTANVIYQFSKDITVFRTRTDKHKNKIWGYAIGNMVVRPHAIGAP